FNDEVRIRRGDVDLAVRESLAVNRRPRLQRRLERQNVCHVIALLRERRTMERDEHHRLEVGRQARQELRNRHRTAGGGADDDDVPCGHAGSVCRRKARCKPSGSSWALSKRGAGGPPPPWRGLRRPYRDGAIRRKVRVRNRYSYRT